MNKIVPSNSIGRLLEAINENGRLIKIIQSEIVKEDDITKSPDQTSSEIEIINNQLATNIQSMKLMVQAIEIEQSDLVNELQKVKKYRIELIHIADIISNELNNEEVLLKQYELLQNRFEALQKKYNALRKNPMSRLIYLSWDIFNKIKYNRPIQYLK